jgi:hypothetical protein
MSEDEEVVFEVNTARYRAIYFCLQHRTFRRKAALGTSILCPILLFIIIYNLVFTLI